MYQLLSGILKWIISKLLVLCLILAVLLVGAWFHETWKQVTASMERISMEESRIERMKEAKLKIERELQAMGPEMQAQIEKLRNLETTSANAWKKEKAAKRHWEDSRSRVGWFQKLFDQQRVKEMGEAYASWKAAHALALTAQAALDVSRKAADSMPWLVLEKSADGIDNEIQNSQANVIALRQEAETKPMERLVLTIYRVLPTALWILAAAILIPVIIKVLMYYWLAPMAAKMPVVRILPGTTTPPCFISSAVSQAITLDTDHELFVRQDYLQSSGIRSTKRTRWFLNPSIPFTSLASGMVALTALRCNDPEKEKVTLSPVRDALSEIGLLELPAGCAMVIQPRALVGVINPLHQPVNISRHWRLFSMHSWLTLQLRYLAFHGPCTLVLKGCRGVRAESPDAANPRILNQSATIGFSANLDYANYRSETFWAYFVGKEDLFNDRFDGTQGIYIYEEMPALNRKAGITGRGLEGVLDGILKAFGI